MGGALSFSLSRKPLFAKDLISGVSASGQSASYWLLAGKSWMYVSACKPLAESGKKHPLCFAERSLTWTGSAECSGTGSWVRSMGAPASVLKSGSQHQQTRGELLVSCHQYH